MENGQQICPECERLKVERDKYKKQLYDTQVEIRDYIYDMHTPNSRGGGYDGGLLATT